ncbi:ABC transporter ATP-binding protein [Fredinandcohnia sp. QZ13]|uniref:ABC transporter ATP-binding protein n=1 Tax=Fredinandcohnia sp. QZ13 TaxID=3073144 RepID=UPI0028535F6F|nr:ABC transporter ATP-binding protein [Fredinandcohnia sp. QZ13]MDR4886304.1 ABC transporter ATP-binding protein [Fredinandcohnia sp. QZ13]
MIKIENIVKSYRIGGEKLTVLKSVSLSIKEGSYISLRGPSGSGKSTLLNVIGGLEPIDSGGIWIEDQPVHSLKDHQLAKLRLKKIGYVFQQFQLLSTATALENVMMPLLSFFSSKMVKENAIEALKRVGLEHRMYHLPSRLSGGEQQRVAIARALVTKPRIILADEPTGNLDSETGHNIISLLEEIHQNDGVTIMMITHDNEIAERAIVQVQILDGKIQEYFTSSVLE